MTTVVVILSGTTWVVPNDCGGIANGTGEFIDTIGGGGSGAVGQTTGVVTGGGGGARSRITALQLTPGSTVTLQVGAGGASVNRNSSGQTVGNPGTDTFFNGASLGASSVGAKAGLGGTTAASGALAGPAGGAAGSGVGATKQSGGAGGSTVGASSARDATGGGAAAGTADGNPGANTANNATDAASAGGAADGLRYTTAAAPGAGSTGVSTPGGTSAAGGDYGAGSGAAFGASGTVTSGNGSQGAIIVAYNPLPLISGAYAAERRPLAAPAGSLTITSGTVLPIVCHKAVLNVTGATTVSVRMLGGTVIAPLGTFAAGMYNFDFEFDCMTFGTPGNVNAVGFYHT